MCYRPKSGYRGDLECLGVKQAARTLGPEGVENVHATARGPRSYMKVKAGQPTHTDMKRALEELLVRDPTLTPPRAVCHPDVWSEVLSSLLPGHKP